MLRIPYCLEPRVYFRFYPSPKIGGPWHFTYTLLLVARVYFRVYLSPKIGGPWHFTYTLLLVARVYFRVYLSPKIGGPWHVTYSLLLGSFTSPGVDTWRKGSTAYILYFPKDTAKISLFKSLWVDCCCHPFRVYTRNVLRDFGIVGRTELSKFWPSAAWIQTRIIRSSDWHSADWATVLQDDIHVLCWMTQLLQFFPFCRRFTRVINGRKRLPMRKYWEGWEKAEK